jgi:hypothetical protein
VGGLVGIWTDWMTANQIAREVTQHVETTPGLTPGNGGSMDAYRHCLVRCRLNSEMGPAYGTTGSVIHEISNTLDGQTLDELNWDRYNYLKGRECSEKGAGKPGGGSCQDACMTELVSGHLGGLQGVPQGFPDPHR